MATTMKKERPKFLILTIEGNALCCETDSLVDRYQDGIGQERQALRMWCMLAIVWCL